MPTRIIAAPFGAEAINTAVVRPPLLANCKNSTGAAHEGDLLMAVTPLDVVRAVCPPHASRPFGVLQTSLGEVLPEALIPSANGLVHAVRRAYSGHHHLQIRPDDVWLAVLTQFSFYVNRHAEELRDRFVAHRGREKLTLTYAAGGGRAFDFGIFAEDMNQLIEQHVVDPELRSWMMPDFSTTDRRDRIVASIAMMGTTQSYFEFECLLLCGIPSVTLLGEKEDYEAILRKLDKLPEFGAEPAQFAALLRPVLRRMVLSFDDPTDLRVIGFWERVFCASRCGSGSTIYNGWITAFCFWAEDGKCLHRPIRDVAYAEDSPFYNHNDGTLIRDPKLFLSLDGARYHHVESNDVPAGWTKVPVQLIDHGRAIETEMVAGSVGIVCSCSAVDGEVNSTFRDTMRPESAWWIVEKDDEPARIQKQMDKIREADEKRTARRQANEKRTQEWKAKTQNPQVVNNPNRFKSGPCGCRTQ